jgi:phage shock protein A
MPGLLDKLNTLVKASLSNLVDEATKNLPTLRPPETTRSVEGQIAALRKQIDAAIAEEDRMAARITAMDNRTAALDVEIDAALQRGDEITARQLAKQLQNEQRQVSFSRADLEQHRRLTSEFISRVSQLEAVVADARHQGKLPAQAAETPQPNPAQQAFTDLLRDMRDRIETAVETIRPPESATHIKVDILQDDAAPEGASSPPASNQAAPTVIAVQPAAPDAAPDPKAAAAPPTPKSADEKAIDDDLSRRRSRLSKPE